MINFILLLFLIIVGVWFCKVKNSEQQQVKRRKELLLLSQQLIYIQICLLMARKENDKFFFEIEIARYMKDYLLECLTDNWRSRNGTAYVHPYVVLKYPDLFCIFEMDDKEKQSLERVLWHMEQETDDFERQSGQYALRRKYFEWREKSKLDQSEPWEIDCAYEAARIKFSKECGLKETIPYSVMFIYEKKYDEEQRYYAEKRKNGDND